MATNNNKTTTKETAVIKTNGGGQASQISPSNTVQRPARPTKKD